MPSLLRHRIRADIDRPVGADVGDNAGPEDLAVVGFDDFPWASSFRPQLTVVAQPAAEIGKEAVALMLARLGSEAPNEPVRRVMKGELVVRESCGARLGREALEKLVNKGGILSPS